MKINQPIESTDLDLEKAPSESTGSDVVSRKKALKKISTIGQKAITGLLSLSFIGLSAKTAKAQFDDLEIARALNFLLVIEFMQESFYLQATTRNGFLNQPFQNIFAQIRRQHQRRIILINNNVGSLGLDPTPAGGFNFNFRSGGRFDPFNDFEQFLSLAQIIEDLAAGVYKQQAGIIYQNNASARIKRLVLRLHSLEARHAYYIRFLRNQRGFDDIKGWISQTDLGTISSSIANIYVNEDQTIQQDIDVPSVTESDIQAVQEAWDEPIGRGLANDILQLFTRPL